MWTQTMAIELCRRVESVVPAYGLHVALTGGTLYGHGHRKDCDLVLYRIRQAKVVDSAALACALEQIGFCFGEQDRDKFLRNFVLKVAYRFDGNGPCLSVDILFPEAPRGEYRQ